MPSEADGTRRIGLWLGLLAWLSVAGLLMLVFQDQLADRFNPNRNLDSMQTAETIEITLQPSRGGHYTMPGTINGEPVDFLLDTGATQVAIPADIADRIGLSRGSPVQVRTANGQTTAYRTQLSSIGLGDIVLRDVSAHVMTSYDSDSVLLGMSALQRLNWRRENGALTLQYQKP